MVHLRDGMGNFRIYLETTMFNFPFVPDKPGYAELKAQTLKVFELIKVGRFTPYTSLIVLQELRDTAERKRRENMLALIREYNIAILTPDDSALRLAGLYVSEGLKRIGIFMPAEVLQNYEDF